MPCVSAGRTLPIVVAAAVLAIGLPACGGDDSSPTTTEASQDRSGSNGGGGSGSFVPREHEDSGGGSSQFRTKGGDNSIQDFGEESDASDFKEAASTLHGFLDARAAEDWESACSFLSEEVRQMLEKLAAQANRDQSKSIDDTSCARIMAVLTNPAAMPALREEAAQADVASLRVEGDRAFIIYRGPKDTVVTIPMANKDGSWKVASLGGTPIAR
jgi:hypothetical protein